MPQIIDVPNFGKVEFPDGMSDADIVAAIKKTSLDYKPTENEGNRVGNFFNGLGLGLKSTAVGVGQLAGSVSDDDVASYRKEVRENASKPGGFGGQLIGGAIPAAATSFIPGGNTAIGSTAYNGIYGALQPAGSVVDRIENAAAGAAGGLSGQLIGQGIKYAGKGMLSAAEQRAAAEASRNLPRDSVTQNALDAGYTIPRSLYNPSFMSNRLESLAGKAATKQEAATLNQEVTNSLARKSLGLPDDAPLTQEAMQSIRRSAYNQGYRPIERAGLIQSDKKFIDDLNSIVSSRESASNSFPNAVNDNITPFVKSLKVGAFDAGDALKMTQILRDEASAAYRAGDNALGAAKKQAAKAIEDAIERNLESRGANAEEILSGFRDARTLMAKSHTVEEALREGAGMVDANKLAARVQAGKPMSGDLKTIGEFANVYPQVSQLGVRIPTAGVSKSEALASGLLGVAGSAATGSPYGLAAALLPFAAHPARAMALSRALQKMPDRGVSLLPRMPSYAPNVTIPMGTSEALGLLNN